MNKLAIFFRESALARFLLPAGLIFVVFGCVMFFVNKSNSNYTKTEAVVSKTELVEEAHTDSDGDAVEATYKVFVKYTVNGKEYDTELGDLSGEYKVGKAMTIYYNPDDPKQITQTISLVFPLCLMGAGCVMFIGGIISAVNAVKKYKKMHEQEKEWEKSD